MTTTIAPSDQIDFPTSVVDMGAGRCLLWLRADIDAWAKERG